MSYESSFNRHLKANIARLIRRSATTDALFDEAKHPRKGGKFTTKGGGDSGATAKPAAAKAPATKKPAAPRKPAAPKVAAVKKPVAPKKPAAPKFDIAKTLGKGHAAESAAAAAGHGIAAYSGKEGTQRHAAYTRHVGMAHAAHMVENHDKKAKFAAAANRLSAPAKKRDPSAPKPEKKPLSPRTLKKHAAEAASAQRMFDGLKGLDAPTASDTHTVEDRAKELGIGEFKGRKGTPYHEQYIDRVYAAHDAHDRGNHERGNALAREANAYTDKAETLPERAARDRAAFEKTKTVQTDAGTPMRVKGPSLPGERPRTAAARTAAHANLVADAVKKDAAKAVAATKKPTAKGKAPVRAKRLI